MSSIVFPLEPILTYLLLAFNGDFTTVDFDVFVFFVDVADPWKGGLIEFCFLAPSLSFDKSCAATGVMVSVVGTFLTFELALMLFLMSDNAAIPFTPIYGLVILADDGKFIEPSLFSRKFLGALFIVGFSC